ncbi:hypothetical protein PMAYCL1PPCAC_32956, partial [Pristionchus mayeri]
STESVDYSLPDLPPYLLISSSSLLNLFVRCPSCGDPSINSISFSSHGSAVVLKWKCDKCVNSSWPSQPRLCGRFYEGNAKIATAAHTTGLSLPKRGIDLSIDGRWDQWEDGEGRSEGGAEEVVSDAVREIRSVSTDNDAKIGKMLRDDFKAIKHLLDFWHLVKGINHDLRELAKKKSCPNIKYWRKKLINHAHYVHSKFAKSRKLGLQYWLSALAHVTGRHRHFCKVPFLNGIVMCKHSRLGSSASHLIKRDSDEFQQLKAVIMKPTFLAGFLRASPKKNTSPNECFNSIINLYAPKRIARSPKWYGELIKLAHLHYNTLAQLDMLNLREELGSSSAKVIGREGEAVKRKMAKADHAWRRDVWAEIPGVIEKRKLELFMRKVGAPTDREYVLAMQEVEKEDEVAEGAEEREEVDGGESDVSEELGGGLYGEEMDSDHNAVMEAIELSDAEDEESEEEGGGEAAGKVGEGSEWDEGEAGERWRVSREGGRGRGRGRGTKGGRGRGGTV